MAVARRHGASLGKGIALTLFLALVTAVGVWRYFAIPRPIQSYLDKTTVLTLEAAGYPAPTPYGFQVAVRLEGVPGILYYAEPMAIAPGDTLFGSLSLSLPNTVRSKQFFKATLPYTLDEAAGELSLTHDKGRVGRYWPARLQRHILDKLGQLTEGEPRAFLSGILAGDRSDFSDALTENLFTVGMSHVAAVSGLHVSTLVGFLVLVVGNRRWAAFAAFPLIFVFVAMTGFSASAMRAGIMVVLYLLAPLIRREYSPVRALAVAFLILSCTNPYMLFEPALQLSFTATLGLIVFGGRWQRAILTRVTPKNKVAERAVRYLAGGLASSCAALVFSVPVAAYWFDGVSLLSPLCNLLFLWLFNVIFLLGVLTVLLGFVWMPLAVPFAWLAERVVNCFCAGIGLFARIPYAVLYTSQVFLMGWLLFLYALFVLALFTRCWKGPLCASLAGFVLCMSLTHWQDRRFRLEITVLDVGQGSCLLLRSGGETAVIDCGGVLSSGRRLTRLLQSKGERRIDTLYLTHYDQDHCNGLPALLENVAVGRIVGPEMTEMPTEFTPSVVTSQQFHTLGNARIQVIPVDWMGQDSNDDGCIYLITMDGFSLLETGDLNDSGERWLVRWLEGELPQGGVFLAGHHGSGGSNAELLLDRVQPAAVIVSAGENNRYGHPSPDALERFFSREMKVYRTDRSGNVVVKVP